MRISFVFHVFRAQCFFFLPFFGSRAAHEIQKCTDASHDGTVARRMAHAYIDNVFIRNPQPEFMACTYTNAYDYDLIKCFTWLRALESHRQTNNNK